MWYNSSMRAGRRKTSISLTPLAHRLLGQLAERSGLNSSATVEVLIRQSAREFELGVAETAAQGAAPAESLTTQSALASPPDPQGAPRAASRKLRTRSLEL